MTLPKGKATRAPTVYFIAIIKFTKGIAALLLAIGVFSLRDKNLPEEFRNMLEFLHLDPEKKFFLDLADRIGEITASNVTWVSVMAIVYSLFMLLQGIGLAFRVRWAVWLVILESGFFIPIELFELVRPHNPDPEHHHFITHPRSAVFIVLAINVMILWYLLKNRERIIRHHQSH